MAFVANNRIPLEICLSSNLQSCVVNDLSEHPFRFYLKEGLRVCLNTDNTLFARTSPVQELRLAVDTFDLTLLETENLLINGFRRFDIECYGFARTGFVCFVDIVFPSTGIGASALVGITM